MRAFLILLAVVDIAGYLLLATVDWRIAAGVFIIMACNMTDHYLTRH
jgi:hypothetical protein